MQVTSTALPDVKIIVPPLFRDRRGYFSEPYNQRTLRAVAGIDALFVQDNHSRSEPAGVVRGLHFQKPPHAQAKLIRVLRGSIFDVAVDIRRGSPTFGQHVSMILSANNHAQAWIPIGFAHGLCTLEPGTEVLYKVTAFFEPTSECGIAWNDPALAIAWPMEAANVLLSDKDKKHPPLAHLPPCFQFAETD
jgi:dTDP-4-dehydrorhamnose 3,5-epimerase